MQRQTRILSLATNSATKRVYCLKKKLRTKLAELLSHYIRNDQRQLRKKNLMRTMEVEIIGLGLLHYLRDCRFQTLIQLLIMCEIRD